MASPPDPVVSDDEVSDDELPFTSRLTNSKQSSDGDDQRINELHERRSATHSNLRAYEAKRRTAYESKLQSTSLYWHAFRTLMHDSLLETQKADLLLRGWTHASNAYATSMASVGEWCIDEKGVPITDPKKKKKHFEDPAGAGDNHGAPASSRGASSLVSSAHENMLGLPGLGENKHLSCAIADFYREEKCGSMIKGLANSAACVAGKYDDMAKFMNGEVLFELSK